MTFKHHFSQVLVRLFEAKLLTLSVVNKLWITFTSTLVFSTQRRLWAVDNLLIAENLMWSTRCANLEQFFYTPFPQAIIIHTFIFLEK